jgi:hypothetical protein
MVLLLAEWLGAVLNNSFSLKCIQTGFSPATSGRQKLQASGSGEKFLVSLEFLVERFLSVVAGKWLVSRGSGSVGGMLERPGLPW